MATIEIPEVLSGEGETKLIRKTRVRIECGRCGNPAVYKHTYLLPNGRSNPASSAYGRDDCTWCSDHQEFVCKTCPSPRPESYSVCAIFTVSERFAHMFLHWIEEEVKPA